MSEPCSRYRQLTKTEFAFVLSFLEKFGKKNDLSINDFRLHSGREKMVIKTPDDTGKKKIDGKYFIDSHDDQEVYVDFLTSPDFRKIEIWFWKPLPNSNHIQVPRWSDLKEES